jgi:hypothetical protein
VTTPSAILEKEDESGGSLCCLRYTWIIAKIRLKPSTVRLRTLTDSNEIWPEVEDVCQTASNATWSHTGNTVSDKLAGE